MSTGYGEGEGRVKKAIEDALHSPLLNDNDIFNSKKILATGFGIESIDGMGSHLKKQSQEDLNRIAAEQERAAERQDRRNRYYGGEGGTKRYKRRPNIYLFRPEDLDNDDVISAVESTPTYKRTREILESINSQANGDIYTEADNSTAETKDSFQGTIRFD